MSGGQARRPQQRAATARRPYHFVRFASLGRGLRDYHPALHVKHQYIRFTAPALERFDRSKRATIAYDPGKKAICVALADTSDGFRLTHPKGRIYRRRSWHLPIGEYRLDAEDAGTFVFVLSGEVAHL